MDWPGNPVAKMWLAEGEYDSISVSTAATTAMIEDSVVRFTAECYFIPASNDSRDSADFSMQVFEQAGGTWTALNQASVTATAADPSPTVSVDIQLTSGDMKLRLGFFCSDESRHGQAFLYLEVQRGPVDLGSFTLGYIPASIVYCPPGQDMTASLTQSRSFGTTFTIGYSDGAKSTQGSQLSISFSGVASAGLGIDSLDSESLTNKSTTATQITHFRNTVVTADNQRAIGRAYWGPLGDIFVILLNPQFKLTQNFDGSIAYMMMDAGDVVLLPAWKLLRPLDDPIASAIPADVRKQMLQLDPFMTNLDLFFPDSGADLSEAADPTANPTAHERAELIGVWWPDNGVELSYTFGESQELDMTTTQETDMQTTFGFNFSEGGDIGVIKGALDISVSDTATVGYQTSKETSEQSSVSASCLLIRSQNDRDLSGIEVYYDRVFSTLMFRKILADGRHRRIAGFVTDVNGAPLARLRVTLDGGPGDSYHAETFTSTVGQYRLANVPAGDYSLRAGDQERQLTVNDGAWLDTIRGDFTGASILLDISQVSLGALSHALGLNTADVRRGVSAGLDWANLDLVARFMGATPGQRTAWGRRVKFAPPDAADAR